MRDELEGYVACGVLTRGFALAYDSQLLGGVGRIFVDTVLGWYRKTAAERGIAAGQSGSITVIQRLQSDLRLNPHYHAILLDGVFASAPLLAISVFGESVCQPEAMCFPFSNSNGHGALASKR